MEKVKKYIAISLRGSRRFLLSRTPWGCLLVLVLACIIFYISNELKYIYIREDGKMRTGYSTKVGIDNILAKSGIDVGEYDEILINGIEEKIASVVVNHAFPVNLRVDGKTKTEMTTKKTVSQFLKENDIVLNEFDISTPSTTQILDEKTDLTVQRVELQTRIVEQEINYNNKYKYNSLLRNGRYRTIDEGEIGKESLVYIDRIVDGVHAESELVKTVVTKNPKDALVLIGSDDPVSELDFGIPLDQNGNPIRYKKVLYNQICTGYSSKFKIFVKGASGMQLKAGSVAVRPQQFPYGTKFYIKTPDNKFKYGFAIAADTGTALMDNIIDFDLFYETYRESALNGRKYCTVYILE